MAEDMPTSRSPASRSAGTDPDAITLTTDTAGRVVELAVHGRWDPQLRGRVATGLRKCFAQHSAALIIDLCDLGDRDAASAAMWWTARLIGTDMDPPVQVVVCAPAAAPVTARLRRLGARRSLPLYATMSEARTAAAGRLPLTERLEARLAPTTQAPAFARRLVADACTAWSLPSLLYPAKRVVSELVLNAVEHAGTESTVTVSRRGPGIHLAVADRDRRLPTMPPANPRSLVDHRGTGLGAVQAIATVAGVLPTRDGKMFWAVLRP